MMDSSLGSNKANIGATITDGPKVKPRRGEENEQANDTGRNRIGPAELMV
jgi:hypothetical protein